MATICMAFPLSQASAQEIDFKTWEGQYVKFTDDMFRHSKSLYDILQYYAKTNDLVGYQVAAVFCQKAEVIRARCQESMHSVSLVKMGYANCGNVCKNCFFQIIGATDVNLADAIDLFKKDIETLNSVAGKIGNERLNSEIAGTQVTLSGFVASMQSILDQLHAYLASSVNINQPETGSSK
jgi:hypothetical protein